MKVQPDIFSSGNKKKKKYRTTNSRIKYSSNGFRIYICTNKHHRWGVSSNIYRMFPSNHKRQHFKIKIFLHEQYSGKTNATIEVSRQIYTEYFQRTVSTTGISNLYLKATTNVEGASSNIYRILSSEHQRNIPRATTLTTYHSPITNE